MRGLVVILVLTVMPWMTGCERAKTKLDREVDRLCAIDGGVHIYEQVRLPKENFGPSGEVFPKNKTLPLEKGRYGPDYFAHVEDNVLVAGDPVLRRVRVSISRRSDGKVLGELIVYHRSGGDLPGPWEPTSHSCPAGPVFNLEQRTFIPEGN